MICRLCLENLNVEFAIRLFDNSDGAFGNSDVVAMIAKYFQLEVTPEDSVSTRICQVCFDHMEDFNRFWKRIDKKQQSLQEQYKAEFLEVSCGDLSAEQVDGSAPLDFDGNLSKEDDLGVLPEIKFEREDIEEFVSNDVEMVEDVSAAVLCKIESDGNTSDSSSASSFADFEQDSFSSDDDVPLKTFGKSVRTDKPTTKAGSKKGTKAMGKTRLRGTKSKSDGPAKNIELDCQKCETKIKSFDDLTEHFKDKHGDQAPFIKCCEKKLTDKRKYMLHMKWHRDADKSKCTYCGKILSSERSLKSHVQSKHEKDDQAVNSLDCAQCEKSFASKKFYENHMKWHENQGQFICETCGKAYTKEIHLKRHVQSIHNHVYPYKCPACNECFNFKEELDSHDAVCEVRPLLTVADGEKVKPNQAVVCKICNKIFAIPKYLKRHMKAVHADTAPMVCDQCGKNFKCRPTFEKHVLEHAGVIVDQPVQCQKCGKWCKNKISHKFHFARHDEILNKCHLCDRECPSRRALKGHMESVHRPDKNFPCQFCEKSFKSAHILKEHVAKHTGTKLYTCPHCPKEFRSKANMYGHIKKNHVDEWIKAKLSRSYDPNLNPPCN